MSLYEASVEHAFSARHALPLADGKLEPSHEHTWRLKATFRSSRLEGAMGVVVDFTAAQQVLADAVAEMDGADLNQLAAFKGVSPSAERVAEYLATKLTSQTRSLGGRLHCLSVTEAVGCSAAFYPGIRE